MIIELGELAIRRCTCPENEGSKSKKRALFFAKRDANLKLALRQRIDGGRSSMVEPQIVVLVVAGSSPVGHPTSVFDSRLPILHVDLSFKSKIDNLKPKMSLCL